MGNVIVIVNRLIRTGRPNRGGQAVIGCVARRTRWSLGFIPETESPPSVTWGLYQHLSISMERAAVRSHLQPSRTCRTPADGQIAKCWDVNSNESQGAVTALDVTDHHHLSCCRTPQTEIRASFANTRKRVIRCNYICPNPFF